MALELELKKVGFSDKEAKVYLALLELGSSPVQEIAKKAKVNRATTYIVLEALKKRGVVSAVEESKKSHFAPESPATLMRLFRMQEREVREKEEEFKKALPELDALFRSIGGRPVIRFFEGKEAINAVRTEILSSGTRDLLDIYSLDYVKEIKTILPPEEEAEFLKEREQKGIRVRSLYTSKEGKSSEFKSKSDRRYIDHRRFPFYCDIVIFGSKIAITTLKGQIVSVIIESQEIADTLKSLFELAWDRGEI